MNALLIGLAAALLPAAAFAQYAGPAVETCRNYAEREIRSANQRADRVVFDKDPDLRIERYTRKVGNQFVSSLLEGSGAIVYSGVPSIEFRFLCLLADERRAVFFHWMPRRDAPPLVQCSRGGGSPGECLNALHQLMEAELTEIYAKHYTDALQAGGEPAADKFRRSAETWKAYRDAECGRRRNADEQKACVVALTRQRASDLR
jgi:hypothetical protein